MEKQEKKKQIKQSSEKKNCLKVEGKVLDRIAKAVFGGGFCEGDDVSNCP